MTHPTLFPFRDRYFGGKSTSSKAPQIFEFFCIFISPVNTIFEIQIQLFSVINSMGCI